PQPDPPPTQTEEPGEEAEQLLAEARAGASELRLTLQLFPSTRRGDADHLELTRMAEELDAQVALLEGRLAQIGSAEDPSAVS
ncbi:MAG: hypothetical protein JKY65_25665, partial [Planctomycetes bacterium]|nr:hypothetical protein [Planctomycetota bacterium]